MSEAPAGNAVGFEEEALPHLDAVYRFALRLSGSPDLAEDLVQETFLRAYKSWGQYTKGTAAKSWLFTICRNVFLRRRERSQRHVHDLAVAEGASEALVVVPVLAFGARVFRDPVRYEGVRAVLSSRTLPTNGLGLGQALGLQIRPRQVRAPPG